MLVARSRTSFRREGGTFGGTSRACFSASESFLMWSKRTRPVRLAAPAVCRLRVTSSRRVVAARTRVYSTRFGVVGLVACCVLLGAAAPIVVDAQTAKEAVAEGLGWQGVYG